MTTDDRKPPTDDASSSDLSPDDAPDSQAMKALLKRAMPAPADEATEADYILKGVQKKLRQRSRGKFFGDGWSTTQTRMSYGLVAITMLILLCLAFFGTMVVIVVREFRAGAIATLFDAMMYGCVLVPALVLACVMGVYYLTTGETAAIDPSRRVLIFDRCPRSGLRFPPYFVRREASFDEVRWVSYHGPIFVRRGPTLERLTVRFGTDGIAIQAVHGTGLRAVAESIAEATGAPLRWGPEPGETRNGILLALGLLVIGACIFVFALRGQFPAPTPPSPRTAPPPAGPAPAP